MIIRGSRRVVTVGRGGHVCRNGGGGVDNPFIYVKESLPEAVEFRKSGKLVCCIYKYSTINKIL